MRYNLSFSFFLAAVPLMTTAQIVGDKLVIPNVSNVPASISAVVAKADSAKTLATANTLALSALTTQVNNLTNNVVIDAATQFGIVADPYNSTAITDNSVKLMAMRTALAGPDKPFYTVRMPAGGVIRSSNNRWAYGIERLIIDLNGSKLQAVYSGNDDAFKRPLWIGDLFQSNTLNYSGSKTFKPSYLFNTVQAGSSQITLTTAAETANFAVGNRVLLWGRDQVGNGYPPGTRYNEWRIITAINAGVITLSEPLENSWNQNWHDVLNLLESGKSVGKPRILNLDIPGQVYSRYLEIRNGILGDATGGGRGDVGLPSEQLVMNHVQQEQGYWWPSEDKLAIYNDCSFQNAEWDKVCGTVIANRCRLTGNLSGGSGINRAYTNYCQFGNSAYLGSREWYIDGCYFTSNNKPDPFLEALSNDFGKNPMRMISLKNSHFASGASSQSDYHINVSQFTTFAIPAVSGTDIVLPFGTYTDANANLAYRIQEGQTRLFKSDGTNGGRATSWVFDPTYNEGQGAWRIGGTWSAPTAGNTWVFSHVANVIDGGNNVSLDGKQLWNPESARMKGNQVTEGERVMKLTEKDFKFTTSNTDFNVKLYGWVSRIEIQVKKTHKNSANSFLEFVRSNPGFTTLAKFNLLQNGRRTVDEFSAAGSKTGDVLVSADVPQWTPTLSLILHGSGRSAAAADLPEFDVLVYYTPF